MTSRTRPRLAERGPQARGSLRTYVCSVRSGPHLLETCWCFSTSQFGSESVKLEQFTVVISPVSEAGYTAPPTVEVLS